MSDEMVLMAENRLAKAMVKEPVLDDDGFVTHYEKQERLCAVHMLQIARDGFVCEFEDGTVAVVPYDEVRFVADEGD